jgi:hypothetical protein
MFTWRPRDNGWGYQIFTTEAQALMALTLFRTSIFNPTSVFLNLNSMLHSIVGPTVALIQTSRGLDSLVWTSFTLDLKVLPDSFACFD